MLWMKCKKKLGGREGELSGTIWSLEEVIGKKRGEKKGKKEEEGNVVCVWRRKKRRKKKKGKKKEMLSLYFHNTFTINFK